MHLPLNCKAFLHDVLRHATRTDDGQARGSSRECTCLGQSVDAERSYRGRNYGDSLTVMCLMTTFSKGSDVSPVPGLLVTGVFAILKTTFIPLLTLPKIVYAGFGFR